MESGSSPHSRERRRSSSSAAANRSDPSRIYADRIRDHIESFHLKLRRGKFSSNEHQSQSIAAARQCAAILREVVVQYHEAETQPGSKSIRALKAHAPAVEVSTMQVTTLIRHLTRAGAAMQRGPFFRLLLTNVTRRVLSIVRASAEQSLASLSELERLASDLVNEIPTSSSSDDEGRRNVGGREAEVHLSAAAAAQEATSAGSCSTVVATQSGGGERDDDEARCERRDSERSGSDGDYDDADDVEEMEGAQPNFFRSAAAWKAAPSGPPQQQQHKAQAQLPLSGGLKRSTFMLTEEYGMSAAANSSPYKSVSFKGDAAGDASARTSADGTTTSLPAARESHAASRGRQSIPIAITSPQSAERSRAFEPHAPEPGSLLSDFLSHTPPKNILARAPSILGEADVAMVREFPVKFEEFIGKTIDGIRSFESDLEVVTQELCKRAARQLHSKDTIVTLGCSHSVMSFLLKATEDCTSESGMFQVIILEGRPLRGAHRLAAALRERGVSVQVLPDSSVFAVMGSCTKALIGVENVLANGGILAPIGTHPLCIAANAFRCPVLVATMTLKMTPYYPSDALCTSLVKISRTQAEELPWSTFAFPGDILLLEELFHVDPAFLSEVQIVNPVMEYVPPHLISLFATNEGEYTVPQIHRIVRDNYNPEDSHL